jgi:hypothetical protein
MKIGCHRSASWAWTWACSMIAALTETCNSPSTRRSWDLDVDAIISSPKRNHIDTRSVAGWMLCIDHRHNGSCRTSLANEDLVRVVTLAVLLCWFELCPASRVFRTQWARDRTWIITSIFVELKLWYNVLVLETRSYARLCLELIIGTKQYLTSACRRWSTLVSHVACLEDMCRNDDRWVSRVFDEQRA